MDQTARFPGHTSARGGISVLAGVMMTLLVGCGAIASSDTPLPTTRPDESMSVPVTVRNVVDGDTIDVQTVRGVERVRLIGVDTPETKKPRTAVQCWGEEATQTMRNLVEDRDVLLEYDDIAGTHDRYGRTLAYVWIDDTLINGELIRLGSGRQYAYRDQNYRYRQSFEAAERTAKEHTAGLWSACP